MSQINIGDAGVVQTNRVVGIVREVDYGRSLAWIIWQRNSGMSDCIATGALDVIAPRDEITAALQRLMPINCITSPFEQALLERQQNLVVIDQPRYRR